jgi:hypothetical protein
MTITGINPATNPDPVNAANLLISIAPILS